MDGKCDCVSVLLTGHYGYHLFLYYISFSLHIRMYIPKIKLYYNLSIRKMYIIAGLLQQINENIIKINSKQTIPCFVFSISFYISMDLYISTLTRYTVACTVPRNVFDNILYFVCIWYFCVYNNLE